MTCRCSRWTAETARHLVSVLADYCVTVQAGIDDRGRLYETVAALFADEGTEDQRGIQDASAATPSEGTPVNTGRSGTASFYPGSAPTSAPPSVSGERPAEPLDYWVEMADRLWTYVFDIDLDGSTLGARHDAARWMEANLGRPHANDLAALRAENERLRQQVADLELDLVRWIERYGRARNNPLPVPPGENRSEG